MSVSDPTFTPSGAGGISTEATNMLTNFWPKVTNDINILKTDDFKQQELPLARIKKIMKLDEDVKMISAEAPVLFAKAAEIFVSELSLRAWLHTEDNKRRTLQRNDIAMAITKFDQFDFLIDIVPRDELKPTKRPEDTVRSSSVVSDQIQYYIQLAQQQAAQQQQQQQAAQQQQQVSTQQPQTTAQIQQVATQQAASQLQQAASQLQLQAGGQVLQSPFQLQMGQGTNTITTIPAGATTTTVATQPQTQVIQVQAPQQVSVQQPAPTAITVQTTPQPAAQVQTATAQPQVQVQQAQPSAQVYQQVITPSGEMQNIPIQLTPGQLQAIQMQLQGKLSSQPIIIQTTQQQTTVPVQTVTQTSQSQQFTQPMFQVQQLQVGQDGQQVFIQPTGSDGDPIDIQDNS